MGIFQLDVTESVFGDMPDGNHIYSYLQRSLIGCLRSLRLDPGEGLKRARKDVCYVLSIFLPYVTVWGGGVC